jgi:hypothetical protein
MSTTGEWNTKYMSLSVVLTCIFETPEGSFCPLCSKDLASRKNFTDHYRTRHAPFYVTSSSTSDLSQLPHQRQLILCIEKKVLLERKENTTSFLCDICARLCGPTASKIKAHYETEHNLAVTVSSNTTPNFTSSRQCSMHHSAFPLTMEAEDDPMHEDDEYGDAMPIDLPPTSIIKEAESFDSEADDDDAWEAGSSTSDAPTEVLIQEDEDDVVPPSFNLHNHVHPSSDDCSLSLEFPQPEERIFKSSSAYGSDSKHLY